jgi:hypothetical protein
MNTMDVALNRRLSTQNTMNGGRQKCARVFTFTVECFIFKPNKTWNLKFIQV